jgi:hypothetical protein
MMNKEIAKIETEIPDSGSIENNSTAPLNILEKYLNPNLSDGFDFPVGNPDGKGEYVSKTNGETYPGWYKAVRFGEEYSLGLHPAEDWNGSGGGNTDLGQPVFAIAKGKVIFAKDIYGSWGNVVIIEHQFLENAKIKTIYSLYAHLDEILVSENSKIDRRQKIGSIGDAHGVHIAHLHFEIRKESMKELPPDFWPSSKGKDLAWVKENYENPTDFINHHRKCTYPASSSQMMIAIKNEYKMYHLRNGDIYKTYEIALSQDPVGHKVQQGDNRLPEGEYKIIQKLKGPIGGEWGKFFGVGWLRLNYPNNFDAINGFEKGLITETQKNNIIQANNMGNWPPKDTKLGGGIGIHGWAGEWENDGYRHLTWGCISMHNYDLKHFFEEVEVGDKVLILP